MSTVPSPPPARRPSNGTVERLYVLWLVSSLLLVLLVVIVALLATGQLRRQAQRISEHSQAIDSLRDDLSQISQELRNVQAALPYTVPQLRTPPTPVDEARQPAQPIEEEPPGPQAAPPALASPDDGAINALLQAALRPSDDLPFELADPAAAEEALRVGQDGLSHTSWAGQTWARLAVLARLLDRDLAAETFAYRAAAANVFPQAYYELSVRKLLDRQQAAEAIVFARRLVDGRPADPKGVLLLAEAHGMHDDLAAADEAIETLATIERLSLPGKLRLGRLLVALERWERLGALLDSLGEVPQPYWPRLNFLRAVLAIQRGQLAEAYAILDNLLAEPQTPPQALLAADDYELRTWRGVALVYARQFEAAREALAHAQEYPERPQAWYWRGMLELHAGNADQAIPFLQYALAASQRFAPAWEALGTIALNHDDLPTALQNLSNAASYGPPRASTHLLLAILHAKASRPSETAEALRTAFGLDPSLLETARQTEVITRLFSEDQLAALASRSDVPPREPDQE